MTNAIQDLLQEIIGIHSEAEIEKDVTDQVTTAVEAGVPALVTAATASLQTELDATKADLAAAKTAEGTDVSTVQANLDATTAALKALVDKLNGQPQSADLNASVIAAQNVLSSQAS